MHRRVVLDELADGISGIWPNHPVRVAIDGVDASGKTTMADELARLVEERGRPCLRASIDDFHQPGHRNRSARGDFTSQTYFDEAYDYDGFKRLLLAPLGPDGDRRCRLRLFDVYHDQPFAEEWVVAAADSVVIVDGIFLFRPELVSHWDYTIWLVIDLEEALRRARARDVAWVGSEQLVEHRYRTRNFPAHRLYLDTSGAPDIVDTVIDNSDPDSPRVIRSRDVNVGGDQV
jgi:uridine kinase